MPPNWSDFSQENIRISEMEREASIRLRGMICSTLSQTSADMRDQADRVEEALGRRIAETEEATRSLEEELKAVSLFKEKNEENRDNFFQPLGLFFDLNHILQKTIIW